MPQSPQWTFDPRLKGSGYRDTATGRVISRAQVLELVNRSVRDSAVASDTLSAMWDAGQISPDDWKTAFRQQIKDEYVRQYLLGKGGVNNMTPADYGSIGGMLREQYRYLDGFAEALPDLSPAQVQMRMRMYLNSAREAYERAWGRVNAGMDKQEVLWVMSPQVENCEGCQQFAALGWVAVAADPYGGALPGSGDTPCLTNCQCHLEYR